MDVDMGDGGDVRAARRIRETMPETRILGVTTQGPELASATLLEAGAETCMSKDTPASQLVAAIRGDTDSA